VDALKTALQVLTDIAHHQEPDACDLVVLRHYAEPRYAHVSDEEIACAIIARVAQNKEKSRASRAGA